jgi:hypothetical protein
MTERPDPDYIGPTVPDGDGVRRAVPDATHERFHEAVKDVLAGRILPKAREQMRDAINAPLPHPETTASISKPFPTGAL